MNTDPLGVARLIEVNANLGVALVEAFALLDRWLDWQARVQDLAPDGLVDETRALAHRGDAATSPRAPAELQRAHDLLVPVITGEVPWALPDDDRVLLRAACDVLCWALKHDHNTSFTDNLVKLEQLAAENGYLVTPLGFSAHPERPIPNPAR